MKRLWKRHEELWLILIVGVICGIVSALVVSGVFKA
jgi:uncharacterized membrane protein YagU involved in acid resistance